MTSKLTGPPGCEDGIGAVVTMGAGKTLVPANKYNIKKSHQNYTISSNFTQYAVTFYFQMDSQQNNMKKCRSIAFK